MLVRLQERRLDVAYFLEYANQDPNSFQDNLDVKIAEAELKATEAMIAMIKGTDKEEINTLNSAKGSRKALLFFNWRQSKGWKTEGEIFIDNAEILKSTLVKTGANAAEGLNSTVTGGKKYFNSGVESIKDSATRNLSAAKQVALKSLVTAARSVEAHASGLADSIEVKKEDEAPVESA
jgi:hypothetical protein